MERPRQDDDGIDGLSGLLNDFAPRWLGVFTALPPDPAAAARICNDFIRDHTKRYSHPVCSNADTSAEGTKSTDRAPEHTETECPICLDTYGAEPGGEHALQITGVANCRHVFGSMCLKTILMTNPGTEKKCPLCRATWVAATYAPRSRPRATMPHQGPSQGRAGRPQTNRNDLLMPPTLPFGNLPLEMVQRYLDESEAVREHAMERLRVLRERLREDAIRALPREAPNPVASRAPATGDTSVSSLSQRVEEVLRSGPASTNGFSTPPPPFFPEGFRRTNTMEERLEFLEHIRSTRPAPRAERIESTNATVIDAPPDESEVPRSNDLPIDLTSDTPPRPTSPILVVDTDMEEPEESIVEDMRALEEIRERARATSDRGMETNRRRPTIPPGIPTLPQNPAVQRPNNQNRRTFRADMGLHGEELAQASEALRQIQRQLRRQQMLDEALRSPRRSNGGQQRPPPVAPFSYTPLGERTRRPESSTTPQPQPSLVGLLEREYRVTQRELACQQREARLRRREERINRFMVTAQRHSRELVEAELQLLLGDTRSERNESRNV